MMIALEGAMPVIEADEKLKGPVSDAQLYDVVLASTGDEEAASAALTHRIEQKVRRGEWVDI